MNSVLKKLQTETVKLKKETNSSIITDNQSISKSRQYQSEVSDGSNSSQQNSDEYFSPKPGQLSVAKGSSFKERNLNKD